MTPRSFASLSELINSEPSVSNLIVAYEDINNNKQLDSQINDKVSNFCSIIIFNSLMKTFFKFNIKN